MRRIAIGRENWRSVGSAHGSETVKVLFTFTSSCQRLGVEPWGYLQDVLNRLPGLPAKRRAELLPDRWQAARQAQPNCAPPAVRGTTHELGSLPASLGPAADAPPHPRATRLAGRTPIRRANPTGTLDAADASVKGTQGAWAATDAACAGHAAVAEREMEAPGAEPLRDDLVCEEVHASRGCEGVRQTPIPNWPGISC